jgi:TonB-dependent receptor
MFAKLIARFFSLTLIAAVTFLFCVPAGAQGRGIINGRAVDQTGAVLPGALVEVQDGPTTKSDQQGNFTVPNVLAGSYQIKVSYVGFTPYSGAVTVASGQISHVDAVLVIKAKNEEITVNGERQLGEIEAVNIERTADNIVQVLPSKVIMSLPNTNVADAAGRLPSVSLERDEGEGKYIQIRGTEPRLTNTTVNGVDLPSPEGDVRNIKLDVIPSALVDRIEVNKTLSANQDGNAIGGSVNLVTKTPSNDLTWDIGGLGGYTPIIGGRGLDSLNGTVGERFGRRKKWGFLLGGSYDWNGRGINDLEPSPGTTQINGAGPSYAFFSSADLRTYRYYRTRYGFSPELDYEIKPGSDIYVRGLYSDFHDFGDTWVYSPNVGALTSVSPSGTQLTFDNTGSMQMREYVRRPDQQVFSGQTGGHHDFTSMAFTWEFTTSRSHNIGGQDFETTRFYTGPSGIQFGQSLSNPLEPQFAVLNGVNIFDPTQYFISQYLIPNYHSTQLNVEGAASLQKRYSVKSHYGAFEIGFKGRNGHKTQNENDAIYTPINPNDPRLALSNFVGSFQNPSYYDHAYTEGPLSDYGKIQSAVIPLLPSAFTYDFNDSALNNDPAYYAGDERVMAGYAMNTIGWDKFTLQTGVRVESTSETYNANQIALSNGNFVSSTPITGAGDYINVLPSVQLQYHVQENTNIRATFGMGLSRPNFADLVPARQVDPNTPGHPSEVQGNPNLKATVGHNYDLLAEHYFKPFGILQAGFFYKELSDPIYNTTTLESGAPFSPGEEFFLNESINGPRAHIEGFETAWEQRLSFLPGMLSGLGVSANYSYTTSRVSFPTDFNGGRTDHPTLQRTAPNNWNLGFTYDKSRFAMRFAVSHNDASIYSYFYSLQPGVSLSDPILGLHGPNGDQYLYAHTQYDIQASYHLYKGLSAVGYGLNLSNEAFGFYQGSRIYPIQREFYKPTAAIGFRWNSARE